MNQIKLKVNTVEQYKILKYIRKNLYTDCVELELVDKASIKVIFRNNQSVMFKYEDGEVRKLSKEECSNGKE